MAKPVARLGDMNIAGGIIFFPVSTNVTVNGRPVATVGSMVFPHAPFKAQHAAPSVILIGSFSVTVNNKPIATTGSMTTCGHPIGLGSLDVMAG